LPLLKFQPSYINIKKFVGPSFTR